MKTVHSLKRATVALSLLATAFISQQLHAQTTWSGAGADDLWSTPENWGGIIPVDGSSLIFDGATRLNNTNDLTLNGIASITFNTNGFVLNGNSLSLSTSAITNLAGTNVVGMDLTWGTAGALYAAPDSELVIAGALTNPFSTGSSNIIYTGGGRIRFTGSYNQASNNPASILNNAEVVLDGGTINNGGGFRITSNPGASASKMILTNGATMNQTITAGAMRIGDTAGIDGQLVIDHSLLTLVSNTIHIPFVVGGVGSVIQRGGTNTGGVVNFIHGNNSGTGSYDMTGGVLETYQIKKERAGGTATMSFDGSVVRALAGAPTAFFTGLDTAEIKSGGLTIDNNGVAMTVGQVFTGDGRLTKIGSGTLTLSSASSHSGGTTVNGGTLIINTASTAPGGVILSSGALRIGDDGALGTGTLELNSGSFRSQNATARTVANDVTLGGSVTFSSTADLTFTGPHTLAADSALTVNNTNTISGSIGETGGAKMLTKSGTGILILSGDNTYSGNTLVTAGSLTVLNSTGSATGSGLVTVNSTGILTGTGQVGAISLVTGGGVAPGTGVGTLTVTNTASFGAAGVYQVEMTDASLSAGVGYDLLSIQGALDIAATSGSPFVIDLSSMGGLVANFDNSQTNSWIIATAAGGITGFSANKFVVSTNNFLNDLGANAFSVSASGNNLLLNFGAAPTPPSTLDSNIVGAGTTNAQISFSTVSGASYTVQYKTNLNQVGWLNLTNFVATGSSSTAVDNTSPVPAERYYQVISP